MSVSLAKSPVFTPVEFGHDELSGVWVTPLAVHTYQFELDEDREAYLNGTLDSTGDVDSAFQHIYRNGTHVVVTISTGFSYTLVYETEEIAQHVFAQTDERYGVWLEHNQ